MFRKVLGLSSEIYKQGLGVLFQKQSGKAQVYRKKSLKGESLVLQDVKKTLGSSDQNLIVMVRG